MVDYKADTATSTITVEKATPTFKLGDSGGVYAGSPFPAAVAITGTGPDNSPAASLAGVTPTLAYYVGSGTAGLSLGSTAPTAAGTYTVVAGFAGSANYSAVKSSPVTFTIGPGTATIALTSSTGSAVYGQPMTFVAKVAAGNTPSGTVTFFDGGTTLATVALNGSGTATLVTSALAVGSHSITATYSGNADFGGALSGSASESISQSGATVVLVPHPVLKKKKVISEVLTANIEPTSPGGGFPTGLVTFELVTKKRKKIQTKTLGTAVASSGVATLTVKPNRVLSKIITREKTCTATPAASQWADVVYNPNPFVAKRFGCVGNVLLRQILACGADVSSSNRATPRGLHAAPSHVVHRAAGKPIRGLECLSLSTGGSPSMGGITDPSSGREPNWTPAFNPYSGHGNYNPFAGWAWPSFGPFGGGDDGGTGGIPNADGSGTDPDGAALTMLPCYPGTSPGSQGGGTDSEGRAPGSPPLPQDTPPPPPPGPTTPIPTAPAATAPGSQVDPTQPAPPPDAGGSAIIGADDDSEGGASWDEGPPSMSAAPSENFVAGTWNNLTSSVSEFFTRDAAREYETATDPWDRLDAAGSNTLLNKLYHHVATPIAAGAGDALGAMAQLLGDTPGTLQRLGSSAYAGANLLYNDPQAVGEAAYRAYDDFNHLTPTQQNDAYLRFASSAFTNRLAGDFLEAGLTGMAGVPLKDAPIHHIATNKNWVSTLTGGPWSPQFEKIFQKAGMTLEDAANKVAIPGHAGPHPEAYHRAIFDRLSNVTDGLSGQAYKDALLNELGQISQDAQTLGNPLNSLLTGQ